MIINKIYLIEKSVFHCYFTFRSEQFCLMKALPIYWFYNCSTNTNICIVKTETYDY